MIRDAVTIICIVCMAGAFASWTLLFVATPMRAGWKNVDQSRLKVGPVSKTLIAIYMTSVVVFALLFPFSLEDGIPFWVRLILLPVSIVILVPLALVFLDIVAPGDHTNQKNRGSSGTR